MLAVAVAVTAAVLVSLVALLLAVDAGFLAGDDQLLVDSVELCTLLVSQRGEDLLGNLVLSLLVLLGNLAAFVGQLDGVGFLALGILDGDVVVALRLADDVLEHLAVHAQADGELALGGGSIGLEERAQQGALAALVALGAVLVLVQADELARLLHLGERLGIVVHALPLSSSFPFRCDETL
jgi:hypothetical protein